MVGKAITLAESEEWDALQVLIEMDPSRARDRDRFGLLPLHWACTEEAVPIRLLVTILEAYPEAARTKNNTQMLPLHIAVQSQLPVTHLKVLVEAYPSAVDETNELGQTPIEIEKEMNSASPETFNMLKSMQEARIEDYEVESNQNDHIRSTLGDLVGELRDVKKILKRSSLSSYEICWNTKEPLGLTLSPHQGCLGAEVSRVLSDGNTQPGDWLYSINDEAVMNLPFNSIIDMLKTKKRPMNMRFVSSDRASSASTLSTTSSW